MCNDYRVPAARPEFVRGFIFPLQTNGPFAISKRKFFEFLITISRRCDDTNICISFILTYIHSWQIFHPQPSMRFLLSARQNPATRSKSTIWSVWRPVVVALHKPASQPKTPAAQEAARYFPPVSSSFPFLREPQTRTHTHTHLALLGRLLAAARFSGRPPRWRTEKVPSRQGKHLPRKESIAPRWTDPGATD